MSVLIIWARHPRASRASRDDAVRHGHNVGLLAFRLACSVALVVSAAAAAGCGSSDPAGTDAGLDAGLDAGMDAGFDASLDAGPPWPHVLPDTTTLGTLRGRRLARAIIHAHSPLSHDACDGMGWVDGSLHDPTCLAHMRAAACDLNIDALSLTDHSNWIFQAQFDEMFWPEAGDEIIHDASGNHVASTWACPGGHRVLVTVGTENALMPIGLAHHVIETTDPTALDDAYDADGPAAVGAFRTAGALVFVAHTESRALDYLRTLGADGIEIYNLHANVDPHIRQDWLGLGMGDYLPDLLLFLDRRARLEPDLSFLSFFSENANDLAKYDALGAEGVHVTAIAGTDCHENTFPDLMPDGERGDSYRRMMRWFGNYLLVDDVTYDGTRDALTSGRSYIAFDAFGTPVGFDFRAEVGATVTEMGGTAPPGATVLQVMRPHLDPSVPSSPAPRVILRLLRSGIAGVEEVASTEDFMLTYFAMVPGAYRAEVHIVPEHVRPYLGAVADRFVHDYVWIYSNAIQVPTPSS